MKNAARGSALLILVALIAVIYQAPPIAEAVTISASDSQNNIQFNTNEILHKNNNIEKVDFNVDLGTEAAASSSEGARIFRATAYCLRGKTASGRYVRRGIVAADTRVLRLGTRIHLTAGKYTGNYLVADTGGRIRGRVLDIWVPSCAEARRWGRRTVKVRVLSKGKSRRRR